MSIQSEIDRINSLKFDAFNAVRSKGGNFYPDESKTMENLPYAIGTIETLSDAVESGNSGNWQYRKYSDGFCVLMFTGSVTGSATIQLLGGFNSDASVTYPFALKEVYSAHANVRLGSGTGFGYVAAYGSSCSVYAVGNQNSRTVNMSITIFGRWK